MCDISLFPPTLPADSSQILGFLRWRLNPRVSSCYSGGGNYDRRANPDSDTLRPQQGETLVMVPIVNDEDMNLGERGAAPASPPVQVDTEVPAWVSGMRSTRIQVTPTLPLFRPTRILQHFLQSVCEYHHDRRYSNLFNMSDI